MSIKSRVARLERKENTTLRPLVYENLHARRPEDVIPDQSGIDWNKLLFGPRVEVTDVVEPLLRELEAKHPRSASLPPPRPPVDPPPDYPPGYTPATPPPSSQKPPRRRTRRNTTED